MEKQIAQFGNRGMYQDTSISKATNEFAFENLNIKITALEDNTLFTVTNVKEPNQIGSITGGTYLGHCVLGRYVVVFIKGSTSNTDKIVRLDYNGESFIENQLYIGNLGFNNPIECLPYYESEEVQKVYWVDGENYPRMINIINVWKTSGDDTQFDFNPSVDVIPNVSIKKKYEGLGLFSSGVIQYFITYYDKFGTESAIAWASPLYYINYEDRGASPDDIVTCHFKLTIEGADNSYDNIRVYSLKRTSFNGDVQCNIVTSLPIPKDSNAESKVFEVIDTNKNQESIDPTKLYFIGGDSFISSTIAQKDNTLFFGDIKTKSDIDNHLYSKIKEILENSKKRATVEGETIQESSLITFVQNKREVLGHTDKYYYNNPQSKEGSNTFKTFKRGELYRFAIQFQTKRGEWSAPIWIGDKQCNIIPQIDTEEIPDIEILKLADIECDLSSLENQTISIGENSLTFKDALNKLFYSYRVLMADTSNDRSIVAQGVVCPTLFNYDERCNNRPFSIASWIMRPRRGNAEWKHLGHANIEICGQDRQIAPAVNVGDRIDEEGNIITPEDGENLSKYNGVLVALATSGGKRLHTAIHNMILESNSDGSYNYNFSELKLIKKTFINTNSWKDVYWEFVEFAQDYILNITELAPEDKFVEFARAAENKGDATVMGGSWVNLETDEFLNSDYKSKLIPYELPNRLKNIAFLPVQSKNLYNTGKNDLNYDSKKNNYYVDNTILTFHSPDTENAKDVLNNSDLEFRIVGIVPITASFSDADIQLKTKGLSLGSSINKNNIKNYPNISKKTNTLISEPLYVDYDWVPASVGENSEIEGFIPSTLHTEYNIFLWHKQGSIIGQNELTFKSLEGNNFDDVPADLKRKIFATQRFSANTTYFNSSDIWNANEISTLKYFSSDNIEIEQLKVNNVSLFYYGNYDRLLTYTEPYTQGRLQQYDPVRVKYKTSPHLLFSLQRGPFLEKLPLLGNEDESFSSVYNVNEDNPKLVWEQEKPVKWSNDKIAGVFPEKLVNKYESFGKFLLAELNIDVTKNQFESLRGHYILLSPDEGTTENKGILTKISKMGSLMYNGTEGPNNQIIITDATFIPIEDVEAKDNLAYNLLGSNDENPFYDIIEPIGVIHLQSGQPIEPVKGIHYLKEQTTILNHRLYDKGFSYLYMGELYRKLEYDSIYGGTSEDALELITWLPITESVQFEVNASLPKATNAEGDTYYQRWDCMKSYPYTEEDINSVIDITSFMVETHVNLEGRYDRNKGTTNILNLRPSNFNLINSVYSQPNNFFTYNVLDSKYDLNRYKNQIVWSLQKTPTADIDVWTDISLASSLNLDGSYGKITKLINNNDTILAFQDKAISAINFNNRTALSTENGVPIEIANSGKVDGYKVVTDTIGCQNKQLMTKANSGLYFVDKLNKSLFSLGADGVKNVSNNGMSVWFRNNIDTITELTYDGLSKDIYVLTSTKALLYNEDLGNFTTFLDFVTNNYSAIFNMEGRAIGFNQEGSSIAINEMNVGDYNFNYRITYRINPEPFLDKTFTNIEYIANFDNSIDNPFKKLIAENEYQYGTSEIVNTKYPTDYKKFRIWRFDVPRDDNTARTINGRTVKLDRIRNPWFNLTLVGNDSIDNNSMEFHNLNVYYYR